MTEKTVAAGKTRPGKTTRQNRSPNIGATVIVPFGVSSARGRVTDIRNGRVFVEIEIPEASDSLNSSFDLSEIDAQPA